MSGWITGFTNGGLLGDRLPSEAPDFLSLAQVNSLMAPLSKSSGGFLHSAIRGCVERILSRALPAEFESSDKDKQRILDKPQGYPGRLAFYRALYEQLLLTGNALVYIDGGGKRQVGITSGSSYDPVHDIWRVQTSIHSKRLRRFDGSDTRACTHFYLGYKEGEDHHFVQSPVDAIVEALMLHDGTRKLLNDYVKYGHKIGNAVSGTPGTQTADRAQFMRDMKDIRETIVKAKHSFINIGSPPEIEINKNPGAVHAPDPVALELALREVCRVYGVPMEMMQTQNERTDYSNVDDHIMSDAVHPLLDMVADGFSRHLNTKVELEPLTALRGVLGAGAKNLTNLGQVDAFTRNEIRKAFRMKPRADGDQYPQAAGAGYNKADENGRPRKEMGATSKGAEKK